MNVCWVMSHHYANPSLILHGPLRFSAYYCCKTNWFEIAGNGFRLYDIATRQLKQRHHYLQERLCREEKKKKLYLFASSFFIQSNQCRWTSFDLFSMEKWTSTLAKLQHQRLPRGGEKFTADCMYHIPRVIMSDELPELINVATAHEEVLYLKLN